MLRKSLLFILFLGLAPVLVFAQTGRPVKQVADADIVGSTIWSKDTVYVLNGFVFVESGETLTIEAGTVVKGKPGQGTSASALIVARGGRIYARGSSSKPIIFTAESDDVDNLSDIQAGTRGLWGGVILLGNAQINNAGGVANIEGIPTTEPRGQFGGTNDHDNSGAVQYLSIRYGGTNIGAANEINGLTFGGVGDSTTVDHIEVVHNADDGYEWFGGTVNTKYLVSAFNDDDAFDYDTGWRGKNQFWFALQGEVGNRGAEMDGADTPVDGVPYAIPLIYNATYIGSGATSTQTNNDLALLFRVNGGGKYYNGLFTDFYGKAIEIDDQASGKDSRERLDSLDLVLQHNLFYGFGSATTWTDLVKNGATTGAFVVTYMSNTANDNQISDPMLYGISRTANAQLDPRPKAGSPALSGAATPPSDGFFTQAGYKGAFGPNAGDNWLRGWTYLDQAGYVATPQESGKPVKVVADKDITTNTTFKADTIYVLNGFVFVESGETLTIEAGTVVKGKPGQGTNASALIVARGGRIYARGFSSKPIIFTAESDDVESSTDIQAGIRGLWGGVILLGNARINNAGGVANIEGIPSTEPRGQFGGTDDHDNSGVVQYLSIRYGGTNIGAANEINGLTFGGVGDGTTVDHIEVFNNADDGFEWFGGTVNTKYLISAFNDDDAFDYDTGWRGKNQFWFALQGEVGNRGAEMDGADTPVDGLPYAIPLIYNATYIGSGASSTQTNNDLALLFRVNGGGKYYDGLFTDFYGKAIEIEDLASGKDSRERLDSLDLVLQHNLFYGFGTATTWTDLVKNGATTGAFVVTYMSNTANDNQIANPNLRGISRTNNAQLDPRPEFGSPALTGTMASVPSDGFFTQAAYKGAFDGTENWALGWSFLDKAGYFSHTVYQDTTQHDTTSSKKICDINLDSKSNVSDVIFLLLLSRSNPTDSRLDWNGDGHYMINDAVALLLDIMHGNCAGTTLLASAGGAPGLESAILALNLNADDVKFIESQIQNMNLNEEQQAAMETALHGAAAASLPRAYSLSQNSPNPFNPSTTISYSVPEGQNRQVSLKIYDIRGRTVRTLVDEVRPAGTHTVFWGGDDDKGRPVASGVYFYRMQTGDYVMTRKMVLLR